VLLAFLLAAAAAHAQSPALEPHVGYAYPAGGQQGTTVEVTVGGQSLRAASEVLVSGEGVSARVLRRLEPMRKLDRDQLEEILRLLAEAAKKKVAELPAGQRAALEGVPGLLGRKLEPRDPSAKPVVLPEIPLLRDLDSRTLEELVEIGKRLLSPRSVQQPIQRAIAETMVLEVTIAPDAAPGDRELRVYGPTGISNPLCFQVGALPETVEREPNDGKPSPVPALAPPFVLNGQTLPGDVDRVRFRATRGQHLVMRAWARHLMPYLADAVPGWIQLKLQVNDASGNELASADDTLTDPDPVLLFEAPADGEYELIVRDALYRGREDFVYRVAVGESPAVSGDLSPRLDTVATDVPETEPNDTVERAQRVEPTCVVCGTIGAPGDADVFAFDGRAGREIVAEVLARRVGSPMDSLVQVLGPDGAVIAWNDDTPDKAYGLVTHQADSYVRATLPSDGTYAVRVAETQRHGGEAYEYRLSLREPRPDFALRVTPPGLSLAGGRSLAIRVFALRRDGFAGDITVALRDAPVGVTLEGGRIPAGRDSVRMTLTAPAGSFSRPVTLVLEGSAEIGGQTVSHEALPGEDMMQAFAYRHLVPCQQLVAIVSETKRGGLPPVQRQTVRIPSGGEVRVATGVPNLPMLRNLKVDLSEPPAGISLRGTEWGPSGLTLVLAADGDPARLGYQDNLIVEISAEPEAAADGKGKGLQQRLSLGVLPAIPFEVVGG
jgi:hypothetical protein